MDHPNLRITRVDSIDDDALDIAFNNGNIILLQTALILALPGFENLAEDDRILYPRTDGLGIYWREGPRLGIPEIFDLMGRHPQADK
ncbi:hypothetical protein LJC63_02450 [Ruminococcaceae bacterium OttesenSCG-928-L11]|nr:hypothetical protein [Ruminococcaceae bacterium OttesenSCG-928-L11]